MRKLIAIVLAAAFVGVLIPNAQAAETVSREYIGGGARVVGVGLGIITCYEPGQTIEDLYPECEVLRALGYDGGVGGTDLITSGFYSNAVVSIADDFYGNDAGFSPCFYHPEGDLTCDGTDPTADGVQDYPGEAACGTQALVGAPFESNFVSVFVYSVLITEDLDICGATGGLATANLF